MLSTRSASPGTRMDRVEDALAALREGQTVIVVDDESRENEGDLILPAQSATTEQLAFAIRHSTGIICAPMAGQELDRLGIPMMTEHNTDPKRTAFTLSADARTGITTGVSAADRARTVRVLADPGSAPDDLVRPGPAGARGRDPHAPRSHGGRRRPHAPGREPARGGPGGGHQRRRHHGAAAPAA